MIIRRISRVKKIQDLTGYTESDSGSNLTVTANNVTITNMASNTNTYLYKDFGANYFDKIDLLFVFCVTGGASWGTGYIGFSNNVSVRGSWSGTYLAIKLFRNNTNSKYYLEFNTTQEISLSTVYYCRLYRPYGSDKVTLFIYSDAARTTLLYKMEKTGLGTTKWRYFYPVVNDNSGDSGSKISGYTQNFIFS